MATIAARAAVLDDEEEITDYEETVALDRTGVETVPATTQQPTYPSDWGNSRKLTLAAAAVSSVAVGAGAVLAGIFLVVTAVGIAAAVGVAAGFTLGTAALLIAWLKLRGASARHGCSTTVGPAAILGLLQRHTR